MTLYKLPLSGIASGSTVKVCNLLCDGFLRRRLCDLGIVEGTPIEVLNTSPSGDPTAYYIRGAVIALRKEDAHNILVEGDYH